MGRRLFVLLAVCLAVPALALAGARDPKKRIVAADQAKATSVVLKRTDFASGWKRVPTSQSDEDVSCPGYNPNLSDLTLTGAAESEFERQQGLPSVWSYADVYRSKQQATAGWTRTVKPALARCIAHVFRQEAEAEGAEIAIVKQGSIAFPKLAPRTAAFRVAMRMTVDQGGEKVVVPLTLHAVAIGRGRGETGLLTIGVGSGIPAGDLRAFARVLAMRLQKTGV